MNININIEKRHLWVIFILMLMMSGLIMVVAINYGGEPDADSFGHVILSTVQLTSNSDSDATKNSRCREIIVGAPAQFSKVESAIPNVASGSNIEAYCPKNMLVTGIKIEDEQSEISAIKLRCCYLYVEIDQDPQSLLG